MTLTMNDESFVGTFCNYEKVRVVVCIAYYMKVMETAYKRFILGAMIHWSRQIVGD